MVEFKNLSTLIPKITDGIACVNCVNFLSYSAVDRNEKNFNKVSEFDRITIRRFTLQTS
jgi:hypothetical protein